MATQRKLIDSDDQKVRQKMDLTLEPNSGKVVQARGADGIHLEIFSRRKEIRDIVVNFRVTGPL